MTGFMPWNIDMPLYMSGMPLMVALISSVWRAPLRVVDVNSGSRRVRKGLPQVVTTHAQYRFKGRALF